MSKRTSAARWLLAMLICSIPAASAAADGKRGRELVKRGVTVTAANGQTTVLDFERDSTVLARFGDRQTEGRWEVADDTLCFTWGGSVRECWPYRERFKRRQPTPLTSDRGNKVTVTLR